jgi:hypothetical protein
MEWKQRGEAAKLAWERFFREDRFNTMLSLALHHVDSRQIVGERLIVQLAPVLTTIERFDQLLWAAKARLRASSLALLSLLPALPKRS